MINICLWDETSGFITISLPTTKKKITKRWCQKIAKRPDRRDDRTKRKILSPCRIKLLFAKADRLLDGSRKIKFQIPNIKKRNERKISNSDIRSLNFFMTTVQHSFLK